jgi:serine/threonine protein kinase
VAKIANFGLAKLLMGNQTQTFTGVRGTRGYLAPEWSKNTTITVKVDVYSYGVMLLEMISCKKSMELKLAGEECNISEWAYEYVISGDLKQVTAGECINEVELERMVRVGIWCTQNQPVTRPTMKSVVQMMEGSAEVRRPPPPASFSQSLLQPASS